MRIEVLLAFVDRFEQRVITLPDGATVADAVAASGLSLEGIDGYAIHGERAAADDPLADGDRVELLRPLLLDPKEARRRRAAKPR